MKYLLILVLLISGCKVKEEPIEEEVEIIDVEEQTPGDHNDYVVLREGITLPEFNYYEQDYYSNSLALYKDSVLVALYDPRGDNVLPENQICSVNLKYFYFTATDPLDPSHLTMTCDGIRTLFAYGDEMKSIYKVGEGAPDYPWGLTNTLRILYILETSTIVKEIDLSSYLNRGPNDPLIIKNYERQTNNGIIPVYELNEEPTLIDGVMSFNLTGRVGYVTQDSTRPDILGTFKFQGVGADTSAKPDTLTSVIVDGKLGLADKKGDIVVEPQYEPIHPTVQQLFSENFQVMQSGPEVQVFQTDNFILDYQTNSHFISVSSTANGLRAVRKEGKVGFLDEQGNELDTFYFDDALVTHHNRVWVKQGQTWSIIEVGKDIGYQQVALQEKYANEASINADRSARFESGQLCDDGYTLYEVSSVEGLYVRDADNMESNLIGLFNYQQKLCGIEKGEWIEFDYLGQNGYVFKEYTQVVQP